MLSPLTAGICSSGVISGVNFTTNFDAVIVGAGELHLSSSENLKLVLYCAPSDEKRKSLKTIKNSSSFDSCLQEVRLLFSSTYFSKLVHQQSTSEMLTVIADCKTV